jgi:hypothetical protein
MDLYGSLEDQEQINLRIRLTGSPGLRPLLEMLCLQATVLRSHGMDLYGSLEDMKQIP